MWRLSRTVFRWVERIFSLGYCMYKIWWC